MPAWRYLLIALGALAQPDSSVPVPGQYHRYRGAPANSLLSVVPVDGAEFVSGQYFDISIELHNPCVNNTFPSLSGLTATLAKSGSKPEPLEVALNASFDKEETWNFEYFESAQKNAEKSPTIVSATRLALRSVQLLTPGIYTVTVAVGNHKVVAEWSVRKSSARKVKNVILMIGDGMAPAMQTVARYLSKKTRFGKFGSNVLEMEKLGTIGKIITNGIDSFITDSANSASAYTTGHKTWNGALNVYADTSADPFDDPKVEAITEIIRRTRPGMCIGVVTTSEVTDATPSAAFAHTRNRRMSKEIVDQHINGPTRKNLKWTPKPVKADVLMGGGGRSFCNSNSTCDSVEKKDYYQEFTSLGYKVVKSKAELTELKGDGPVLGIFSSKHLDTWIDRSLYPENLKLNTNDPDGTGKPNLDQPGLEDMTRVALNVLTSSKKCSDGYFLLVEAANIDKAMHNIDYDRGLGELLELDRTVKMVKQFAETSKSSGETAIFLTADHGHAYDAYGSVDVDYFNSLPENDSNILKDATPTQQFLQFQKRQALGEYEEAGWPDFVIDDKGLPTKWEGRFRVLSGKVDALPHREDFQLKKTPVAGTNPLYRKAFQSDPALKKVFNYKNVMVESGKERGLFITGTLPTSSKSTVHSPTAVDLYCYGPVEIRLQCSKVMDNTELFFIMADALGL